MYKFSKLEIISICLITLNSIGINIVVLLKNSKMKNDFDIVFTSELDIHRMKSQMVREIEKGIVRVAIYDDNAYWVLDNVVYKANLDKDGRVCDEDAKEIDVFNLSEKEVTKLLAILDSISD